MSSSRNRFVGNDSDTEQLDAEDAPLKKVESLMPTGNEMFRMLKGLDMTYKAEMALYQTQSILYIQSVMEIALWFALFILFCKVPTMLGTIWLAVLHVPRGIFGLIILKRLPKSHEIVENIDLSDIPQSEMSIEKVEHKVRTSLSAQLIQAGEKLHKLWLVYFILSVVANLMDFINFIIAYRWFSVEGHEHSDLVMLFATLGFMAFNAFYLMWIIQLRQKLPDALGRPLYPWFMGMMKRTKMAIYERMGRQQQSEVDTEVRDLNKKAEAQERQQQQAQQNKSAKK